MYKLRLICLFQGRVGKKSTNNLTLLQRLEILSAKKESMTPKKEHQESRVKRAKVQPLSPRQEHVEKVKKLGLQSPPVSNSDASLERNLRSARKSAVRVTRSMRTV
jgi:hypothetical protein